MKPLEELYEKFKQSSTICTDTRKIEKGCLFFALKGENFNGNVFAAEAIKKGASFAIIDEIKYQTSRTVLVDNVLLTLQELANYHRKKLGLKILAITGTNGKTTTKELIAAVLSQKFIVGFTKGNLNNHIGVPLTLLAMNENTEFGVVEMGANHPGEIAELCKIAEPDYGIITNIGKAHLEGFGSFEGVITTKAELYNFINQYGGTLFVNADNPILTKLTNQQKNKITYGTKNADFSGEPVNSPPFAHLKINFNKGALYINSNLIGNFNFENILAAACIGNYFQIDPLKIQRAIKSYQPVNNRSQLIKKGGLSIIMDAYNANPSSMQLSIKSFLSQKHKNNYLILGDMLELGSYSENEHEEILKLVSDFKNATVFLVGSVFSKLGKKYLFNTFLSVNELCDYLQKNQLKNGNILIKGSRGIQLEKVLEYLN